jgi:hypothetical protein
MSEAKSKIPPKTVSGKQEKEPYPRLIIACIIIAAIFFAMVMIALILEFIAGASDATPKPPDLLIPAASVYGASPATEIALYPKLT